MFCGTGEDLLAVPNGKVHDAATLITAGATAPIFLAVWGTERTLVTAGSFLVSGLLFSPDLDLEKSRSASFWRTIRMGWLWVPYAKLIPHRSPLSHHPLFGPLGRIAYFALFLFSVLWLNLTVLSLFLPIAANTLFLDALSRFNDWVAANQEIALWALLGFIAGGALHTLLDVVDTGRKRLFNRWRKRNGFMPVSTQAQPRRSRSHPLLRSFKRVNRPADASRRSTRRRYKEPVRAQVETQNEDSEALQVLLTDAFKTRGASLGLMPDGSKPTLLPPPPEPDEVVKRRPWNEAS